MHSDTLTPLLQFVEFLGLDAWKVAGIDRSGASAKANSLNVGRVDTKGDTCYCMLQHPYFAGKHWTRDELIEALQNAEDFFISESHFYPAPYLIDEEGHANTGKNGFLPFKGESKVIEPCFPCGDIEYGNYSLVSLDVVTVNKSKQVGETLEVLDSFSVVFDIDIDVELDDIRLYFTEYDFAGRDENLDFNCHIAEIRPFSKITENPHPTDNLLKRVTIIAPAFLFKKPILDESLDCLPHALDTYVDEVEVFYERFMPCDYGQVYCNQTSCVVDCDKVSYPICIREKIVYKRVFAEIVLLDCEISESGVITRSQYCLNCIPKEACINYISGKSLDNCRRIDRQIRETIGKLALALHDCDKEFCQCDICTNARLEYYRSIPKIKTEDAQSNLSEGDKFQALISKLSFDYVDGLHPTHGMIQAMRDIQKRYYCKKVGATFK